MLNWVRAYLRHVERCVPQLTIRFLAHNSPFLPAGFSSVLLATGTPPDRLEPQKHISLKPDAVFSISDTVQGKTVLFFLEVDCGTETIASPRRVPSDIRQKIVNYNLCFDSDAYKKYEALWHCELKGFRLLFVTDDVARFSTLCSLVRAMSPADYIWLTVADRMFEDGISAETWARGGRMGASPQSILGTHRCRPPLE